MSASRTPFVSVVVPVYNEALGIDSFHSNLLATLSAQPKITFEILYCNDGSKDETAVKLARLAKANAAVRVITFTRNFGKEMATSAGIRHARGDAIITIDADEQHPINLIPKFITCWKQGSLVVIGLRTFNPYQQRIRRMLGTLFYSLINRLSHMELAAGASDYRLIDKRVQQEFVRLTEHNRISRGLIDWLGFPKSYIEYEAGRRAFGTARYTFARLLKLSIDSTISLSTAPLYLTAYIGFAVLPVSILIGMGMVANALAGDPFGWHATGSAYLIVLLLFLVGLVMLSQGVIGLYLTHIHSETQNRPLYVINEKASVRL